MTPIEDIAIPSREEFEEELRPRFRPFVLRGIASDWPLVKAGRESAEAALAVIERHDSGASADIMVAPPSEQGRIFYTPRHARPGGGFRALVHAILAIRDQPEPQRAAWRAWFEHMVFAPDAPGSADHLPLHARGVTGPPSPERDAMMRRFIAQILSQG